MITRETLELAALAAWHTIYGWCTGPIPLIGEHEREMWRPHLDDGDAARLAVQLGLTIEIGSRIVVAFPFHVAHDGTEPDKLRAWREAVVLCAAAVGAKMKGGEGLALPRGRSSNRAPRQGEHACCGALENGPHKMGCYYKMR